MGPTIFSRFFFTVSFPRRRESIPCNQLVKIRAQRTRLLGLLTPKGGPGAILWEKEEEKKIQAKPLDLTWPRGPGFLDLNKYGFPPTRE
jgi:hypothetical protein